MISPITWELLPLLPEFFEAPTPVIARNLIGKGLWVGGKTTGVLGEIVETEAYLGTLDPASHSYRGMTPRNTAMFGPPGTSYVYLSYGMHFCLNVVTAREGIGEAVLLRAARPMQGQARIAQRRKPRPERLWMNGPGKLCQAMGIDLAHNERLFDRPDFKLVDLGNHYGEEQIGTSGRVGISQGTELPLRFFLKGSPWLSRKER